MALFKRKPKDTVEAQKKEEKRIDEQAALPSAPSLPKGGDAHSYQVILSPHVTEKGTIAGEQNKYIFKITGSANKTEIKKAIENLYKVAVAKVNVSYAQSKLRKVGKYEGRKAGFKKAIVTLRQGQTIDVAK